MKINNYNKWIESIDKYFIEYLNYDEDQINSSLLIKQLKIGKIELKCINIDLRYSVKFDLEFIIIRSEFYESGDDSIPLGRYDLYLDKEEMLIDEIFDLYNTGENLLKDLLK